MVSSFTTTARMLPVLMAPANSNYFRPDACPAGLG